MNCVFFFFITIIIIIIIIIIILIQIPLKFVPRCLINNYASIDSDNGLGPSRWQAIFWSNDGLICNAYTY